MMPGLPRRTNRELNKLPHRVWVVWLVAGLSVCVAEEESSAKDLRLRAESATLAGDHSSALAIWQKLVADNPDDVALLLRLGVSQSLLGRYEEAEENFRRALRIQPANTKLIFNLGLMHFRKGNYTRAEELLKQTLGLDPKFPEVHYHLGRLCEKRGQSARAWQLYQQELNVNPGCSSAWERLLTRNGGRKREISDVAAITFFAACMAISGLLLVVRWRRQKAQDSSHFETLSNPLQ